MPKSKLDTSSARFLSLCYQFALKENWITPEQINAEFNAETLMAALEPAVELRARLLVEGAGVHAKIAPKKSTSAAAEVLQIALDEKICTPAQLLELINIDEHVRYLDAQALWDLLTRGQFWLESGQRVQQRLLAMIETALEQELLDVPRLIRAVTPERIASDLPADMVQSALVTAIHSGLQATPLNAQLLVESLPLSSWMEHVSLAHIWESVILGEVASGAGLAAAKPGQKGKKREVKAPAKKLGLQSSAKPKTNAPIANRVAASTASSAPAAAPAVVPANAAEAEARERATTFLSSIKRVPTAVQQLSSPELLGLESMYAELLMLEDDERAEHIQDSFPNEKIMGTALFALLKTIEPASAGQGPQPGPQALIELILAFENKGSAPASTQSQQKAPAAAAPARSVAPPVAGARSMAPPVAGARSMAPPPPQSSPSARASSPPPPLPGQRR